MSASDKSTELVTAALLVTNHTRALTDDSSPALPLYGQPRVAAVQASLDLGVSKLSSSATLQCRHRPCNSRAAVKAVNQSLCAADTPLPTPPHPPQTIHPTPPYGRCRGYLTPHWKVCPAPMDQPMTMTSFLMPNCSVTSRY